MNIMVTKSGFYVRFGSALAFRIIDNRNRRVWNFTEDSFTAGDSALGGDLLFSDTYKSVSEKDAAANGFYVQLPESLPPGVYDVDIFDTSTPTVSTQVAYTQQINVMK